MINPVNPQNVPDYPHYSWDAKLLDRINRLFKPPKNLRALDDAKKSIQAYQEWEYAEILRISSEFGPHWNIKGKRVLDIGCGLGGKTLYYSELGAKSITAVDIRPASVMAALQLVRSKGYTAIYPLTGDGARLPFPDNCFDVIVSVNVFEHLEEPFSTLSECKRVLVKGGMIYLHFNPFYSAWGAHVENWINIPWPHLFFSDKAIIMVARNVERNNPKNNDYIPSAQVFWDKEDRLPELNRLTVRGTLHTIKRVGLKIEESFMLPIGRDALGEYGLIGHGLRSLFRTLAYLPLLREVITTKMVFILTKS